MGDEFHVHSSDNVNKQNFWYWGAQQPQAALIKEPQCSTLKVIVRVAIQLYGIIGPYFFEDNNG